MTDWPPPKPWLLLNALHDAAHPQLRARVAEAVRVPKRGEKMEDTNTLEKEDVKEAIEVYSIRDAIRSGRVTKVVAEPDTSGDYVWIGMGWGMHLLKLGQDAFLSEKDACGAARAKRDKKIAALEKKIAKLRNMSFDARSQERT